MKAELAAMALFGQPWDPSAEAGRMVGAWSWAEMLTGRVYYQAYLHAMGS